ncbi:coiled-coil domain-containing protein 194 [Emydura macquarii macquarii]|uniref:coiled-coil domain-containing protein 194 n=1 Tax=Emydura macquarii macquarii TaxID=1129001 RepID=UPI00352B35F6
MDPSVTKTTLKVLGLCVVLLFLVAAVTVTVAVMMRHAEVAQRLRGCQERAANETSALGGRVAELEREMAELTGRLKKGAQKEKQLRRQRGQAKAEGRKLNATLLSCQERATALSTNLTALRAQLAAVQREGTETNARHVTLQVELARWQGKARKWEQRLEEALQQHQASAARRGQCEAQQSELQRSIQDYLAEIDSLHRRLSSQSTGRRCPPFWYFVWVMASSPCFIFSLEGLKSYV